MQAFSEEEAAAFPFDVLDPTKIIPEEVIPLRPLGRMVLDRNVSNFFAETEQVAFCPAHLVPGIDFSNDPLLQGRIFSYLDTQLSRLGGPNFHQIPINRPRCPSANFQRDAAMQMETPKGRVSYEPNSRGEGTARESKERGFRSYAASESGEKQRVRPESFRDHYTQPRQFWNSMTSIEQQHISSAFAFELAKCERAEIRERMLGHLRWIAELLMESVAKKLGFRGQPKAIKPAMEPGDPLPSPALSLHAKAKQSSRGRVIGVFVCEGFSSTLHAAISKAITADGGRIEVVCSHAGTVAGDNQTEIRVDHALEGAPSVLFDAIVLAPGSDTEELRCALPTLQAWLRDAYQHMKAIGYTDAATQLVEDALSEDAATSDEAVILMKKSTIRQFITAAERLRNWHREERLLRGKAA